MKIVPGTPLDVERFFKLDILKPASPGYLEPLVLDGEHEGELLFVYSDMPGSLRISDRDCCPPIKFMRSTDGGRTWPDKWPALDGRGKAFTGFHNSVLRLKSGRIGLVYSAVDRESGYGHPGREHTSMVFFRTSGDRGRTWSEPVRVGVHHACCCTGHGLALSGGRIVLPVFRWISPIPGNDAEGWILSNNDPSPTLSYSFCYVSDLVDGISRLLDSEEHDPVNIGNPHEMTVLDFAHKIKEATGAE